MAKLGERLHMVEEILKHLSHGPVNRIELAKRLCKSSDVSISCFDELFSFLIIDGDLEKVSEDFRAPFRLTNRGKAFLVWRATHE